ncbi:hypothetical protein GPALN_011266 [Globodera pallida]|nr:hypothetical protein GPALN_011266 [Globodera pallida]
MSHSHFPSLHGNATSAELHDVAHHFQSTAAGHVTSSDIAVRVSGPTSAAVGHHHTTFVPPHGSMAPQQIHQQQQHSQLVQTQQQELTASTSALLYQQNPLQQVLDAPDAKGYGMVDVLPCDTLLISELPFSVTEQSIHKSLYYYTKRTIHRIQLSTSRGYAFVQMKSIWDARCVLENFKKFSLFVDGWKVTINYSYLSLNQILSPSLTSSSGGYHLTDSVVPDHLQRHSPGFYVQGSTMVGMENRAHDTTNVVYPRQQQQQSVHSATDAFNAVNLPPQITAMIEDDEKDRLKDTLIQPPILSRVSAWDAEVLWREIDTSEAAASGGPFPQIDPSEFNYQLTLYDTVSHRQTFYKTEAGVNMLHLQQLSPGTEYMVAVWATLPERDDINGQLSASTFFCTLCALPEAPSLPKFLGRQSNGLSIHWKSPNCNGAPILSYCLQMAKGKMALFETVYDGPHEQTVISSSDGNALCRFRVFARNKIGRSDSSPVLTVHPERGDVGGQTHHHEHVQQHYQQQQHVGMAQRGSGSLMGFSVSPSVLSHYHQTQPILRPPHSPNVYSTAPRAIKLSWNSSSGAESSSLVQPPRYVPPQNTGQLTAGYPCGLRGCTDVLNTLDGWKKHRTYHTKHIGSQ